MAENKLSTEKKVLILVIVLFALVVALNVADYLSSVNNIPPGTVQPTVTPTPTPMISSNEPKATQKEETTILQNNDIWILNKDFINK